MKKRFLLVLLFLLVVAIIIVSNISYNNHKIKDYSSFVNVFIGTGGHGHTFPGATVPHGMVQPSPDTRIYGWDACSGYHYNDTLINGFSQTHLSGTGCGDLGDVLLMPFTGEIDLSYQGKNVQNKKYASRFSHHSENASPGYYSVVLDRYLVKAEMTASKRCSYFRFTFPENKKSGVILDLDYAIQKQTNLDMQLEIVNDHCIKGSKMTKYWAFEQKVYFYAEFSKPFSSSIDTITEVINESLSIEHCKAILNFETHENEIVEVKVGLSGVSCDNAYENLNQEIANLPFSVVSMNAHNEWNHFLSRIRIKSMASEQDTIFYSALYHTAIAPSIYNDVNGQYRGIDQKIHYSTEPQFSTFSIWDTFRALHPLYTIIDPKLNAQFLESLITKYKNGGVLPKWDLNNNYTGTMIGYHAASLFADAYIKGERNFDINTAFEALIRTAEYDTSNIICPDLVLPCLMPKAKKYKNELGYIPCDRENESVAKALEYAYDDWCIAQIAESLQDYRVADKYSKFAKAYRIYYDGSTGFMRGVDSKGNWRTPFNPNASNHRNDDYCEGTAWQWTWFVPHDVDGLIQLMGGSKAFQYRLDSLFLASSKIEGDIVSADISGLIGQYAHGNEPSHHIAHLYNYAGSPHQTQSILDSIMISQYSTKVDGLAGNEDCGQMSAWYVLNAMGFYQVCPGNPIYSIGRPMFHEVSISLPNDKVFTIEVKNNSQSNKTISKMVLNGKVFTKPFFTHHQLMEGGHLEITMKSNN